MSRVLSYTLGLVCEYYIHPLLRNRRYSMCCRLYGISVYRVRGILAGRSGRAIDRARC